MINLVGTQHSDVKNNTDLLENVILAKDFDHVFTEGISREAFEQVSLQELVDEVESSIGRELEQLGKNPVDQGPEPEYFTNNPLVDDEDLTFLDDVHAKNQMLYIIRDSLMPRENPMLAGINKNELEQKIIMEGAEKEDFLNYLRRLRDRGGKDFGYTAISYPSRFMGYKRELSTDFIMDTEGLDIFEQLEQENDKYQEAFLDGFTEFGIDRFDLQRLEAEERKTGLQDPRDYNWHKQIVNYMEENPYDEVLVIAGLRHVVDGENTLRRMLEETYSSDRVDVKPIDYDGFHHRSDPDT